MNKIIVHKADALTERSPEVPGYVIEISAKLPNFDESTLREIASYYAQEAKMIADVLFDHLPQGIFEPLLVEMMKRRISLYRGVSGS